MKENESRKPTADGNRKKPLYILFIGSLIAAFVIAALPLGSAFAAPTGPGENGNDAWQSKVNRLRAEVSIAQNLQTKPGLFCGSSDQARYRDAYITTLRAAQGVVVGGANSVIPVTGNNSSSNSTSGGTSANGTNNTSGNAIGIGNGNYYANHPEKLLASYLHRLRQLRTKIVSGVDRNGNSNANNAACAAALSTGTTTGTGTGTGTGTMGTGTGTGSATSTPAAPSTTPTATP
jgi:hypothetical protein